MSVVDVIDDFDPVTLTVTRTPNAGYDAQGRALTGTPTTFTISAVHMPVTGRDLQALPEGDRAEEQRWVFTATKLIPQDAQYAPDVLTIAGEPWVVHTVEQWDFDGDTHYRCRASRRKIP